LDGFDDTFSSFGLIGDFFGSGSGNLGDVFRVDGFSCSGDGDLGSGCVLRRLGGGSSITDTTSTGGREGDLELDLDGVRC